MSCVVVAKTYAGKWKQCIFQGNSVIDIYYILVFFSTVDY
jgi:hypothetical protein